MANWRLVESLIQLRHQINTAHPTRSKVSDGSIGDPRHQSNKSDHNPDAQGRVCAIDITHDPESGVGGHSLSRQLVQDARVKYVIFAGEIWKDRIGEWETYRGANPHRGHVHVSVHAGTADQATPWALDGEVAREILKLGSKGEAVRELQRKLRDKDQVPVFTSGIDGIFGPVTESWVKAFQRSKGMAETGQADASVWAALEDK